MWLRNLNFGSGALSRLAGSAPVIQVRIIYVGFDYVRNERFLVSVRAALYDQVALGKILQKFGQAFAAIERRGHLVGINAGELEENVGADSHDRRTHLRRILF